MVLSINSIAPIVDSCPLSPLQRRHGQRQGRSREDQAEGGWKVNACFGRHQVHFQEVRATMCTRGQGPGRHVFTAQYIAH
jgi:hypothetical protein